MEKIEWNGEAHTIREWAEITGIKLMTLQRRIEQNFPLDLVFYQGSLKHDKHKEVIEAVGRQKDRENIGTWNKREV